MNIDDLKTHKNTIVFFHSNLLVIIFILFFTGIIFNGCGLKDKNYNSGFKDSLNLKQVQNITSKKQFQISDFYDDNNALSEMTDSVFNSLSVPQRVAQMIITSSGTMGKPVGYTMKLIDENKAGGILLLGGSKDYLSDLISDFKDAAERSGTLPLIFSTDAEPSLINVKIDGIKNFAPTNSIKSDSESASVAKEISELLKEIGFSQNYAPVCDFPYNKEIIGNRSFGSNKLELEKFSSAFISATQSAGIIATAKHFPGHGNVKGDTHNQLVFIEGPLTELDVFRNAISSGVLSIMVGHIAVRNNSKHDTHGLPATLSPEIVTGLLKNELGFKGVVITDGMNMGALSGFEEPSLKAVLAGCDMILMPLDETQLINSVITEINKSSEIKHQVYNSVKKIIRLKICTGIIN